MASSSITIDDLRSFHGVDRKFYIILVLNLLLHPIEAMHIMALLFWLEESGFPNIITKMLLLNDGILNSVAHEACLCLKSIISETPPPPNNIYDDQIPLTKYLMDYPQQMSLQFLYDNRINALRGITKTMNIVCYIVFEDIMQQAMANAAVVSTVIPPPSSMLIWQQRGARESTQASSSATNHSNLNPKAELWNPSDVPQSERTMFVTFSRGYPIAEEEVLNFFFRSYGCDSIESIYMEEVPPGQQPLFARVIFRSLATIDLILDGKEKVKFTVDGRHMRVRRFVPK